MERQLQEELLLLHISSPYVIALNNQNKTEGNLMELTTIYFKRLKNFPCCRHFLRMNPNCSEICNM